MSDKFNPMVADLLGESAGPFVFTFDGQEYKLGYPTQSARAVYEKLLIAHEWELLSKNRSTVPADVYKDMVKDLMKEVDDGLFSVGQAKHIMKSATSAGTILWIKSLFHKHHPDISKETILKMLADESGLELGMRVVAPFLVWIAELSTILLTKAGQPEQAEKAKAALAQMQSALAKSTAA